MGDRFGSRRLRPAEDPSDSTSEHPRPPAERTSVIDLLDQHDVLLADLDGTLYRGAGAVPGRSRRSAARRRAVFARSSSRTTPPAAPPTSPPTSPSSGSRRHRGRRHERAGGAAISPNSWRRDRRCRWSARKRWRRKSRRRADGDTRGDDAVAVVQGHSPTPGGATWPKPRSRSARAPFGSRATSTRHCPPSGVRCRATDRWSRPCAWPPEGSRRWPESPPPRWWKRRCGASVRVAR